MKCRTALPTIVVHASCGGFLNTNLIDAQEREARDMERGIERALVPAPDSTGAQSSRREVSSQTASLSRQRCVRKRNAAVSVIYDAVKNVISKANHVLPILSHPLKQHTNGKRSWPGMCPVQSVDRGPTQFTQPLSCAG